MKHRQALKPRLASAVLAFAVGLAGHAGATDEICRQLQAFEAAPLKLGKDGAPSRRWVAFEWKGYFPGNYEDICHHSADKAEKLFCAYLIETTNQEFRADLPLRILHCYGYAFPPHAQYNWYVSKGEFRLHGRFDDRRLTLNVESLPGDGADSAVWISVIPESVDEDDFTPPPLNGDKAAAPMAPSPH